MPIAIYRLPILVTKIITDCLDKVELLCISLCSKRADRVLKLCNKKDVTYFNLTSWDFSLCTGLERLELFLMETKRTDKNVLRTKELTLELSVSNDILKLEVQSKGDDPIRLHTQYISRMGQHKGTPRYLWFDDICVPAVQANSAIVYTFWNHITEGLLGIVNYFNINFNCSLDLRFHERRGSPVFLTNLRKVTQYAIKPHVTVRNASVTAYNAIPDEDYKFILENLKVNGRFKIDAETSKNFNFDGKIQASWLSVARCNTWFTLRHLSVGDYEKVEIDDSEYPESEVIWFLEEWMAGKFPKLRKLNFDMDTKFYETPLPKGWRQHEEEDLDFVYKYEAVFGDRNVTAEIYSDGLNRVMMEVKHGDEDEQDEFDDE